MKVENTEQLLFVCGACYEKGQLSTPPSDEILYLLFAHVCSVDDVLANKDEMFRRLNSMLVASAVHMELLFLLHSTHATRDNAEG